MLKEESITLSSKKLAPICDTCRNTVSTVYCRADSAYLCTTCDAEIHSANPLARRHQRVPVMSITGSIYGPPNMGFGSMIGLGTESQGGFFSQDAEEEPIDDEDEDEAASWLLFNAPAKNNNQNYNQNQNETTNHGFVFGGESVDEYLDLVEYNSSQDNQFSSDTQYNNQQFELNQYNDQQQESYTVPQKSYGGDADSVVPVQFEEAKNHHLQQHDFQLQKFQIGMEYETSNTCYGYANSLSHSVSMSSMDVGVVPESTISDVSIAHPRAPKGTIDLFSSPPVQMPTQLNLLDREARVLRYREKKKTRKFEKTIRYASRKAYAETRPRIKGRFAKRTDIDVEVDQMFSSTLMVETGYSIVPSF